MKPRRIAKWTWIVATVFTLATISTSCDDGTVYNRYIHTSLSGWERNDTLFFAPLTITNDGDYAETLGLRVNSTYPFQRLSLVVEQRILPNDVMLVDTLDCLIVGRDGVATGHGISYFQYSFPLPRKNFASGDSIIISVHHNMKREILPGISDVGVCVTRKR